MGHVAKTRRVDIDVAPALRTRLKIAATRQGVTLREYCLDAIQERLEREAPQDDRTWSRLSSAAFARDWNSEEDSAYDDLSSGECASWSPFDFTESNGFEKCALPWWYRRSSTTRRHPCSWPPSPATFKRFLILEIMCSVDWEQAGLLKPSLVQVKLATVEAAFLGRNWDDSPAETCTPSKEGLRSAMGL